VAAVRPPRLTARGDFKGAYFRPLVDVAR
jgi:hypothetical protein